MIPRHTMVIASLSLTIKLTILEFRLAFINLETKERDKFSQTGSFLINNTSYSWGIDYSSCVLHKMMSTDGINIQFLINVLKARKINQQANKN